MSRDIFSCHYWEGGRSLLAPSKQRPGMPGMLLDSQQCTGQSFTTKNYPVQNVNRAKVAKQIESGLHLDFASLFLCDRELVASPL